MWVSLKSRRHRNPYAPLLAPEAGVEATSAAPSLTAPDAAAPRTDPVRPGTRDRTVTERLPPGDEAPLHPL